MLRPIALATLVFEWTDQPGRVYGKQNIRETRRLSQEGQLLDNKSLRSVTGNTANWGELAKDCIAFANAVGGRLLVGIEDKQHLPHLGSASLRSCPTRLGAHLRNAPSM